MLLLVSMLSKFQLTLALLISIVGLISHKILSLEFMGILIQDI